MSDRDAAIVGILRSSAIARAAARVIEAFERAARGSSFVATCRQVCDTWTALDRSLRLRAIGTALVVAVVVHAALMMLRPPPGWREVVVPAIALAQGLLLIAVSGRKRTEP